MPKIRSRDMRRNATVLCRGALRHFLGSLIRRPGCHGLVPWTLTLVSYGLYLETSVSLHGGQARGIEKWQRGVENSVRTTARGRGI
jgi:hypothetical protein